MTTQFTASNNLLIAILHKAEQLIAEGDLKGAAQQLNQAQASARHDPRIYLVGVALARAAKNQRAELEAAQRAVSAAPQWAPATMELAAVYSLRNDHASAVNFAQQAAAMAPDDIGIIERATSIANRAANYPIAEKLLRQALELRPDDVTIRRSLARCLVLQKRNDEAMKLYDELVLNDDGDVIARSSRAQVQLQQGNREGAEKDFSLLVERFPEHENYRYYLAVSRGEVPDTQPTALSAVLFDEYAPRFDIHLVAGLQYQVPKRVAQIVTARYPELDCSVLDLGCGTGLLGVYLGKPKGALIGVDLSKKMIEQAQKHGLYDRFHVVNLIEALEHTPPEQYEVITACDVMLYVGNLNQVLPNALKVLRPGGMLIFSCELADASEGELAIRSSNRYAHGKSAVIKQCEQTGFTNVITEELVLRTENKKPVAGFILIARKP
jgi:predicted TPR repeat methyltransferase